MNLLSEFTLCIQFYTFKRVNYLFTLNIVHFENSLAQRCHAFILNTTKSLWQSTLSIQCVTLRYVNGFMRAKK